ncbi:MAG: hypothetical protein ACTSUE_02675 [Promethearchaeota archaeon]
MKEPDVPAKIHGAYACGSQFPLQNSSSPAPVIPWGCAILPIHACRCNTYTR